MFGKKSKAVVAGLSLVMALAPAVPAFAADGDAVTTIANPTVTKTMKANPGSTFEKKFTFTATPVQLTDTGAVDLTKVTAPAIDAVTTTANGDAEGQAALTTEAFGFKDATKYPQPGVYAYQVAETAGDVHLRKDERDLMTYDKTTYTVFVYVVNGEDGKLAVDAVTAVKGDVTSVEAAASKTKEGQLAFENSYWEYGDPDTDEDTKSVALKVDKIVGGGMGEHDKSWTFTVKFDETDVKVKPKDNKIQYQIVTTGSEAVDKNWADVPADGVYHVTDKQQILFKNVVTGTKYTVTEAEADQDGYKTTVTGGTLGQAAQLTDAGASETVTNTKNSTVVTGVIMNNAPFIVMIGVAAAGVAAYGAAKRKLEK